MYQNIESRLRSHRSTWLITGAAGFIGSNICQRLIDLNQSVVGLDNLSTGTQDNVNFLKSHDGSKGRFDFIKCDIADVPIYRDLLQKSDYVIHQAAIGSVPRSIAEPEPFQHANVDGFFKILNATRGTSVKKFVYASSSSVYGDNPTMPKVEQHIGRPLSPYAATKIIDEIYAGVFTLNYGLPTVGLKYFNVFGRRQNPRGAYAAVIPAWITAMLEERDVYINGDGSHSRDFSHVENVVQANLLSALSSDQTNGQVFNIALGGRTTLLELFDMIKAAVQELTGRRVAPPIFRANREGDIPHSLASIDKAKALLGYESAVDVRTGLFDTVQMYLKPAQK